MMHKMWHKIQAASDREIEELAQRHHVDMSQEFDNEKHARDYLCEQLQIERPDEQTDDPGAALDHLTREHQRKNPGLSYEVCHTTMRKAHPDLARRYAERSFGINSTTGRMVAS